MKRIDVINGGPADRTLLRPRLIALATAAAALLAACGGSDDKKRGDLSAELRRTAYGVPHVKADDEAGLGYGVGYAQAQDGLCVLAESFVTVAGERARHLGAGRSEPGSLGENIGSDYYFRLLNDEPAVQAALRAQSAPVRALMRGWVAGYNRHLAQAASSDLPADCRDRPWVRNKIGEADLIRLWRFYGTLNGSGDLIEAIATAEPAQADQGGAPLDLGRRSRPTASNALALGSEATRDGRGLLLGNPHFPWSGILRMGMLHTTIAGKFDVMGATLPGVPLVGIGFTPEFAWSHTTVSSAHSSFYRLRLDPADPTRYLVDQQSKPMQRRELSISVKGADGKLQTQSRSFYSSEFGWLVGWKDRQTAIALRDANWDNHRMVEEWYGISRARNLDELKTAVQRNVGNPWNNTLAVDKAGRALMLAATPVPRLPAERLRRCQSADDAALLESGVVMLEGRSDCHWEIDPKAPQPGIYAGGELPLLERRDFVHNANDSAWQANPAAPLRGFSPVISAQDRPLRERARFGLNAVSEALAGGKRLDMEQVQQLLLSNRAGLAERWLDDLLPACRGQADLAAACAALAAWDRKAELDSGIGLGYFEAFVSRLDKTLAERGEPADRLWRQPFDPARPLSTPSGLRVEDPAVASLLTDTLRAAVKQVDDSKLWADGRRWGQVQGATRGGELIGLHGGSGDLGIYNAMESRAPEDGRHREMLEGASYVQVVGFDANGPRAQAILAYSQSSDPASPHAADQTRLFARKQWISLPFSEREIQADPALRRSLIRE